MCAHEETLEHREEKVARNEAALEERVKKIAANVKRRTEAAYKAANSQIAAVKVAAEKHICIADKRVEESESSRRQLSERVAQLEVTVAEEGKRRAEAE